MFVLVCYVPSDHAERVKEALFDAGAGRMGNYDSCCFQMEGTGQFRPLPGSEPYIGTEGSVEHVRETRIELVLPDEIRGAVVTALRAAHPYEEPAFHLIPVLTE
jgi:hypothetical protein